MSKNNSKEINITKLNNSDLIFHYYRILSHLTLLNKFSFDNNFKTQIPIYQKYIKSYIFEIKKRKLILCLNDKKFNYLIRGLSECYMDGDKNFIKNLNDLYLKHTAIYKKIEI